jgi:hypothetical protein
MTDPLPHPVLLNTWKHHVGWIRSRIAEAVAAGQAGVDALPREMAIIGTRLMDLYTGSFTPAEIAANVLAQLRAAGRYEYEALAAWLTAQGGWGMVDLPDTSRWAIRLGPADGRYIHLHPGRWVPHTMRVQANTLKSAVMAVAHAGLAGQTRPDLAIANEARRKYLELLPVRELSGDAGLGAVIDVLGVRV